MRAQIETSSRYVTYVENIAPGSTSFSLFYFVHTENAFK